MTNFSIDDFDVDQISIGSGCSGEVYLARNLQDQKVYAAKRFNSMSIDRQFMEDMFHRYAQMPEHEGIIPLHSFCFHEVPYYSVIDFDDGSLLGEHPGFEESEAWKLIAMLADAMGHAHKYGLLHGNLHPNNIFYHRDESGEAHLRVGDFSAGLIGEVHHVDLDETSYYAPPEQLLCQGWDYQKGAAQKWDVYRFGAIAFRLLNQVFPRGKAYRRSRSLALANSGGRPVPVDPVALATEMQGEKKLPWGRKIATQKKERRFREIIEQCLSIDPQQRPVDMREVRNQFQSLEHEFTLRETKEKAAAELNVAESRVTREKLKQKAKLFSARASATILAASFIIATFYLLNYFKQTKESKLKINELDQVVANQKVHINILGNKMEDTIEDLKQSRQAADASFYNLTQRSSGNQGDVALMKELERSRTYYAKILKEVSRKPDALVEKGRALHSLAHIEQKMSRNKEARDHYSKAVDSYESSIESSKVHIPENERHDTVSRLADCYENLGILHPDPGSEEALALLSKAIWYFKQVLVDVPKDTGAALRLAETSFQLGQTLDRQSRFDEAISAYSDAAERTSALRELAVSKKNTRHLDGMIAQLQFHAANSLRKTGRVMESIDAYIATIESVERLRNLEGFNRNQSIMMAKSFFALGEIFLEKEEIEGADKDQVYNEALRLIAPLNREEPGNLEVAFLMSDTLRRLAHLELEADHVSDGSQLSVRGIDVLIAALQDHPKNIEGAIRLADARLDHLRFLKNNEAKLLVIALRGVENATTAHRLIAASADGISDPDRSRFNNDLRRIFQAYGLICAELGETKTASQCAEFASLQLSYQEN